MCLGCCSSRTVGTMKKLITSILSVAFFGGLLYGTYLIVRWFVGWMVDLEQQQALTIIALSGLVLSPAISYFTTRAIETKKLTGQAALERKIELYESFVGLMVKMLDLDRTGGLEEGEAVRRMSELTPSTLIYASNGFIKEWRKFKKLSDGSDNGMAMMLQMEDVLKAIRKDVGHNQWMTQKGDILSVFVNDIETVVK